MKKQKNVPVDTSASFPLRGVANRRDLENSYGGAKRPLPSSTVGLLSRAYGAFHVLLVFSRRSVRVDTDVDPGHFSTVRLAISIVRHGILPSGRGHDQGGVAAQPHRSPED